MGSIKKVTVSSRRSTKIGNDYFTAEMTVESDVSRLRDKQKAVDQLWDYAEGEVDKRIAQAVKDILGEKDGTV